jgi:uncharacterized repeat protein (TIGR01451 family)
VNGRVAFPAAGNGARVTLRLPPGTYNVAERAVAPTDPTVYRSSMVCSDQTRRGTRRTIVSQDVRLTAGQRVTCTFTNVRPGSPAIAIKKLAPTIADAGVTLHYRLVVTNPGDVAFQRANVVVSDPSCDDDPELVDQQDASGTDDTPRTLDPGDTWTYRCSRRTPDGGAACEFTTVDNTGTVTVSVPLRPPRRAA